LKISDALKKAAAACVVRECDQEQPGHFVAYVDESDESYDVSLELDVKRQLVAGSCDCENTKPCRHIAALLLFVDAGVTVAMPEIAPAAVKAKKGKSRTSAAEPLLEQLSVQELAAWLLEMFASNKDLELAFVSRFSAGTDLTQAEVERMSAEAVKTVMGRKRIPDSTQITKLLQLWKDLHKPIVERYRSAPASPEAFDALAAAVDSVMEFANAHSGTAKLQKYAQQLFSEPATQVSLLKQDDAFYKAAGFPISHLLRQGYGNQVTTIAYLRALGDLLSGPRLAWLAESLGSQFLLHRDSRSLEGNSGYQAMVLQILRSAGVFADYADAFGTLSWNPDFNIPLITAWMDAGMYDRAEKAAWNEIERNTKEIHNPPYYKLLEQIYAESGNDKGLLKLLRQRLPQTFDFDNYLLAIRTMSDLAEKKEFRNRLYTAARNVKSEAAKAFLFRLTVHEGNWGRVLEMISKDELGYRDIDTYFERLFQYESKELIRALMQRRDWDTMYTRDQPAVQETAGKVVQKVLDSYDTKTLADLVKRYSIGYQHSTALNMFRPLIQEALRKAAEG
jgi:predicted transcriptional regulator